MRFLVFGFTVFRRRIRDKRREQYLRFQSCFVIYNRLGFIGECQFLDLYVKNVMADLDKRQLKELSELAKERLKSV